MTYVNITTAKEAALLNSSRYTKCTIKQDNDCVWVYDENNTIVVMYQIFKLKALGEF